MRVQGRVVGRGTRRGKVAAGLSLLLVLCAASPARAQLIDRYFPPGIPGYGAAAGVTVLSRERQAWEQIGRAHV